MTYALSDRGLTQTFVVTNTGSVTLPFTLGGHPAFNIPAPGSNEAFDEYEFRFARPWTAYTPAIDDAGIADFGTTTLVVDDADVLPLSHELIAHLLTITLLDVPDRTITLVGPHSGHVAVPHRLGDGVDEALLRHIERTRPIREDAPRLGETPSPSHGLDKIRPP